MQNIQDYLSVMGHNVNIRNVALLNIIYICIVFCIYYIPPHSRLHGEDNVAIKRYVISFWNGVDLRYKLLQGPSVKISIAGIIISRVPFLLIIQYFKYLPMILFSIIYVCTRCKNIYSQKYLQGRDATPYLERNRVGRDAIDAASALTDMGKYLFLERRLPVYDIAVAITKLDMCRYLSEQNNIETKKYLCGVKIFVRHRLSALATDKVDILRWKYSYLLYSRFAPHCDCQI